jgi:hypothetical protein
MIVDADNLTILDNGVQKRKKILTLLRLPFSKPNEGDLVLTLEQKKYRFKVVKSTENKYYSNNNTIYVYVPAGFLVFSNPETGEETLQCCGTIVGQFNYDVSKLFFIK